MLKQVFKVILCTFLVLVIFAGCTSKEYSNDAVEEVKESAVESEYKIGTKTVPEFLDRCREFIEAVYAPKDAKEFKGVASEYEDIVSNVCAKQLTKTSVELTGVDFSNTIKFNSEKYGYSQHQEDGNRKILYNIDVSQSGLTWNIFIELNIDETSGKIYDINVW